QRWPKTKPPPPPGIIVSFHEKGWMDESAHITDTIKATIQDNNSDLVVIPDGLTSHFVVIGMNGWQVETTTKQAEINPEIIRRAFRKCFISNALDGSEDDEIYNDEVFDDR
ncbi:5179_t:CDS:2, partial [Acaulospora morrowiae]